MSRIKLRRSYQAFARSSFLEAKRPSFRPVAGKHLRKHFFPARPLPSPDSACARGAKLLSKFCAGGSPKYLVLKGRGGRWKYISSQANYDPSYILHFSHSRAVNLPLSFFSKSFPAIPLKGSALSQLPSSPCPFLCKPSFPSYSQVGK